MKNFRISRKKIFILILIFIIFICVLFKITHSEKIDFQEDLIFFKIFGEGKIKEQSNDKSEYEIQVIKGKSSYKEIELLQTIDIRTLVNKKVAPGTKGSFCVFLTSNSNVNYEIEILDKNKKPRNFKFEINEKVGIIKKNEVKKVEINWEWPYEINVEENLQDTKDGESIGEFNFEICTIGK